MTRTGRISVLIAALTLVAPLGASADDHDRRRADRDDRWGDRGRWDQRVDALQIRHGDARGRHGDRYRRGHGTSKGWRGDWRRYPRVHGWRPGWQYRWNSRLHPRWGYGPSGHAWGWDRHWNRRLDSSSFITGALIGSTLSSSALHQRGDHRYCEHDRGQISGSARCYRVERLPGGRERRVPLPDRACF